MSPKNQKRLEAQNLAIGWMEQLSSNDLAAIMGGDTGSTSTPPILVDETLDDGVALISCHLCGGGTSGG